MNMKMAFHFGTDGVRGVIDRDFNEGLVAILAESTFRYWSRRYGLRRLLIGYDVRKKSRDYANVVASVAAEYGVDTIITERPTPTPVVAWYGSRFGFDLIIQITASHNPPIYNGFKVITSKGSPASDEDTSEIERLYGQEWQDIVRSVSSIRVVKPQLVDPGPQYVDHVINDVLKMFKPRNRLRVVVDPLFGTAINYTARILRELGMEVVEVHNNYDPNFGGRNPNPESENIHDTIQEVVGKGYDVGIAHDCDADRIAAVDPTHGYLSPNNVITIVLEHLVRRGVIRRGVVRAISTTHIVDSIASKYGIRVYEVPVGFKHSVKHLISGDAEVAGEESSGLAYSWHVPDKDGIYTAALLTMIASEQGSLVNVFDEIIKEYGKSFYRRVDVPLNNGKDFVIRSREVIVERLHNIGSIRQVITIDGVKVVFSDNSWILIRGSGTEPKLRIYAEAFSEDRLNQMVDYAVSLIRSLGLKP
ncbi:phosphoglucomutase/phosphomannomutase family protein [Vulcanisaeta sp.]|uniref:phosphoglucomutase/phosphomannomutase family protein n=1 Tax=Vulcanisaeta sp. TaxID=2020871 RepID=UPI003D12BE7E